MIRVFSKRSFSTTLVVAAARERIDKEVKREIIKPRVHQTPQTADTNMLGNEAGSKMKASMDIRPKCPFCKETSVSSPTKHFATYFQENYKRKK